MKLLGITKNKIIVDKNIGKYSNLEITKVELAHCYIANNDY